MSIGSSVAVGEHIFSVKHLAEDHVYYEQKAKAEKPARSYSVSIEYTNHTYTKACKNDSDIYHAKDKSGNRRVFDYDRYQLSFDLPILIRNLMDMHVYRVDNGYMITREMILNGEKIDYEVYFTIWRSQNNSMRLLVRSAYPRDRFHQDNKSKRQKVSFAVLLYKL